MRWIILSLISFSPLFAAPSQVVLIRHAEQSQNSPHLSLKGRERAGALCPHFLGAPSLLQYGPPVAIYAMRGGEKGDAISTQQTLLCLAEDLGLPLQNQFGAKESEEMVEEILRNEEYEGKMVLICWSHEELPQIATLFKATKVPKKWPNDVYDRFWIINLEKEALLENIPQKLLYGDSSR